MDECVQMKSKYLLLFVILALAALPFFLKTGVMHRTEADMNVDSVFIGDAYTETQMKANDIYSNGYALFISEDKIFKSFFTWENPRDTLTRPTWKELQADSIINLNDTIKSKIYLLNYEKTFIDQLDLNGNLHITFDYSSHEYWKKKYNYIFPQKIYRRIDSKTTFEIDWYKAVDRNTKLKFGYSEFVSYYIYNKADTITTYTETQPCGGTTPEGHTFRFAGESIDSMKVKSKAIYYVAQAFDINGRDNWAVWLYNLETKWMDCTIDNISYTLPVIEDVFIDKNTFAKIRNKAIAIQRRELIEKRDSILNQNKGRGQEYFLMVMDRVLKRLKPNFEDAETANDLYLTFGLRYFVNHVTVFYKGGNTKMFVHIANYKVSEP